MMNKNKAK